MSKTKRGGLSARSFRYILIAFLAVLLLAGISGFSFITAMLKSYSDETASLSQESSSSSTRVTYLKSMRDYLDNHKKDIALAKNIVADSAQYGYQDKFITEILQFAKKSNVNVTGFKFSNKATGSSSPAQPQQPQTQPNAAAGTPGSPATPPMASAAPAGFSPVTVNVTISNPVNYRNLLSFIQYIENNVTKMQIASVSLSASNDQNRESVTTNAFDIEVYLRS